MDDPISELFQEGLIMIKMMHPKVYPSFVKYLDGVKISDLAAQQGIPITTARRNIRIAKTTLIDFLAEHSITTKFVLDGRNVPRALFGKVNLLFPSLKKDGV
jgi:hypothetical protein